MIDLVNKTLIEGRNSTYTLDDLWEAVAIINPKQPRCGDHTLSMLIPNLIAQRTAEEIWEQREYDMKTYDAYLLLTLAYYHLCHGGVYHLKEEA